MRPIVITGFEAFAGLRHNPSAAVLPLLPERVLGHPVHKVVLPMDAGRLLLAVRPLYELGPVLVLHTGVAAGRPVLTVERVAVNWLESDIADNGGRRLPGAEVIEGGARELPVRVPVDEILEALARSSLPAEASDSAGTFLCNQVLYYGLHLLPAEVPVGFVHLAADERLAEEMQVPFQPLAQQAEALRVILETCARRGS